VFVNIPWRVLDHASQAVEGRSVRAPGKLYWNAEDDDGGRVASASCPGHLRGDNEVEEEEEVMSMSAEIEGEKKYPPPVGVTNWEAPPLALPFGSMTCCVPSAAVKWNGFDAPMATYPMIDGHQRSSEVIRGHQRSSKVIRGHQRSSEVIRGHQRSSKVIRDHQRSSEVIRGHQEAIPAR
jgi:hypothetical protein